MSSTKDSMTMSIVGLGYIGLPTAIIAAEHGMHVYGYDINSQVVDAINNGQAPIVEPGIDERLRRVVAQGMLKASTTLKQSDLYVIAVPTPCTQDKKPDLSFLRSAVDAIASVITPGATISIESTIPVGTTEKIAQVLHAKTKLTVGHDLFIAHCPERVLPGNIFYELVMNDRVIGGLTLECGKKASLLYEKLVQGDITLTDAKTAEMVKLVENSSRDVQIAFAHQVASMCEQADIDSRKLIALANKHPRVDILEPSCGVGGHCLAVDPWFLIDSFPTNTRLLHSARMVNDARPRQVLAQVQDMVKKWRLDANGHLGQKPRVVVLGLTYKPNVDDVRESPALEVAHMLREQEKQLSLFVCEPLLSPEYIASIGFTQQVAIDQVEHFADIIVILVKHEVFKGLVLEKHAYIIDVCGLMPIQKMHSRYTQEQS